MHDTWGAEAPKDTKEMKNGDDASSAVEVVGNHIYFYNGIDKDTALALNKTLQSTINTLKGPAFANFGIEKPEIHLHINSKGGTISDGIAILENILRLKKYAVIITHVEGMAASAATFFSIAGDKRYIHPHSYMMIHQLSSGMLGSYSQFQDKQENLDEYMRMIKQLYREYTEVPMKKLDEILKRDIYFNAEKCLEYGLVDAIWKE